MYTKSSMRVVTASMSAYFSLGSLRRQTAARRYSAFSLPVSSRHSLRTAGLVQALPARGRALAAAAAAAREKKVMIEWETIVVRVECD